MCLFSIMNFSSDNLSYYIARLVIVCSSRSLVKHFLYLQSAVPPNPSSEPLFPKFWIQSTVIPQFSEVDCLFPSLVLSVLTMVLQLAVCFLFICNVWLHFLHVEYCITLVWNLLRQFTLLRGCLWRARSGNESHEEQF